MRAAILHGREDLRITEIEPGPLKAGEIRVAVGVALTCGTDLKVFRRGYHARMIVPPARFGHEFAGTVTEAAPGAERWRPGDRVVAANSAPCGRCPYCLRAEEHLCDDLLFLNGAYAASIDVPARLVEKNVLAIKPETPFRDAALTEPLACVVKGAEDSGLKPGQRVLVIGSGPIGLMFVRLAGELGCEVYVAGRAVKRLATARRLGAAATLEAGAGMDLIAGVRDLWPSPFDVVIEAVGKPETWAAAPGLVRKGGRVNFFGGCPAGTTVALDTSLVHYSSLTLVASFHHTPRTIRRALELIEAGLIRAEDFVDGECALEDLPDWFRSMAAGNRFVKTAVRVEA